MKQLYLHKYVHVRKNKIFRNNQLFFKAEAKAGIAEFLKSGYKNLNLKYPKFHKMDKLCKLGILAAEVLKPQQGFSKDTALVFSNSASSLETDRLFQESVNKIPSPSLFVYTLPNLVLGEISIRHKLQSENAFFVEKEFNPYLLYTYGEALMLSKKTSAAVCGWIDLENNEYDVFLCLASLKKSELLFSEKNLRELYHAKND